LPGKHALKLRREGYVDAQKSFELNPLRSMDVTATLEEAKETTAPAPTTAPTPAPPKPDRPEPPKKGVGIATWTAFGIGVVALGGAGVFEIMRGRAEEDVKTERTRVARLEANDRMEGHQTTARVLAGVGAAAILTGGVLLFFDLSGSSSEDDPGKSPKGEKSKKDDDKKKAEEEKKKAEEEKKAAEEEKAAKKKPKWGKKK
jgi:hypothetical protein